MWFQEIYTISAYICRTVVIIRNNIVIALTLILALNTNYKPYHIFYAYPFSA